MADEREFALHGTAKKFLCVFLALEAFLALQFASPLLVTHFQVGSSRCKSAQVGASRRKLAEVGACPPHSPPSIGASRRKSIGASRRKLAQVGASRRKSAQ
eukprot:131805-Amphidinium_carterae.1